MSNMFFKLENIFLTNLSVNILRDNALKINY